PPYRWPPPAAPAPPAPPPPVAAARSLRADRLLQTAAQALAELGIQPHDTQLVPRVAQALDSLITNHPEEPLHDT
ncbi:MAG: hypothetical protein HC911_10670, partial [Chloroflexaceae bacterium]|nr:hypothetical protein [Chloroflexaceae bacterium]